MEAIRNIEKHVWVFIIIIFFLGFLIINPFFFKNSINHDSPQGYLAGDAYWHTAFIKYVMEKGKYSQEPDFITGNNPEKVTTMEPPFLFYVSSIMSQITGMNYYDAPIFLLVLFLLGTMLCLGFLLKSIHPYLPIVAAPAFLLLFLFPFLAAMSWGFWKFYISALLLMVTVVVFITYKLDFKLSIFLGILFGAMLISHPTNAFYFVLLMGALFCYDAISSKKINFKNAGLMTMTGLIGLIVGFDYLMNFYAARLGGQAQLSSAAQSGYTLYGANAYFSSLGIIGWISVLGILSLILIKDKEKKRTLFLLFCFYLLFFGPLIGIDRIYQLRLIWPIAIATFFGMAFILLFNVIPFLKKYAVWFAIAIFVIFASSVFFVNFEKNSKIGDQTVSLIDDSYWQGITVANNLDVNNILVIDPTMTQSSIILNINKTVRYLERQDVLDNKSILESQKIFCAIPLAQRTGFFEIKNNTEGQKYCSAPPLNICKYDYSLIHLSIENQEEKDWLETQINTLINANFTTYWRNNTAVILKNNEVCND